MTRLPARARVVAGLAAAIAVAVAALLLVHLGQEPRPLRASQPPNFLIILTDDQRWDTLSYTPTVQVLAGRNFTNMYVTTSLCCPSRSSILTGMYAHNHGVHGNNPPFGGFPEFLDGDTLATRLHDAGYRTGLVGKYLNSYADNKPLYVPPGWDDWFAFNSLGENFYFNYTVNDNGVTRSYGSADANYSTDVAFARAEQFLRSSDTRPYFLYVATSAPHQPWTPAPRDATLYPNLAPWRPPSFNEADATDKPSWFANVPLLSSSLINSVDSARLNQLRSLKAIDEGVAGVLSTLQDTGQLDNTIIVFLSDNGYSWGEHRWAMRKQCPWVECARVPMVISYPPLTPSRVDDANIVLNIDIAPTLLDMAGIAIPDWMDGQSLLPLLNGTASSWRQDFVYEGWKTSDLPIPDFGGVLSLTWSYMEYGDGSRELYDLVNDPYELQNQAGQAAYAAEQSTLAQRLATLMGAPVAPRPPSGLAATSNGTQVNLTWVDNATNETGFQVERSDAGGPFAAVGPVLAANSHGFSDASVTTGEQYTYRVAALNTVGLSPYSNRVTLTAGTNPPTPTPAATATATPTPKATATATPVAGKKPVTPSALSVSGATTSSLTLKWKDNSTNETGFRIQRRQGTGVWKQVASVGAGVTSYVNTGLKANTSYSYRVLAYNAAGVSPFSNVAQGKTLHS